MRPLLRLRNVEAAYGRFVALQNVSLVVPEGSVVALLGPNGVGKTTLLRTASGMLAPSAGTIEFAGHRIEGRPDHVIAKLGLAHIPEGRGIFPGLSVRENLAMAGFATADAERAFGHVFELFPVLERRLEQMAGTLSGGEQQMLSLARAIITRPRLLMVDELSLGLAPILVGQLFETLSQIRDAGTTVLLVEQYVRYALRLADVCVVLQKGRVAFIGEPSELAGGAAAAAYLGGTQASAAGSSANGDATSGARRKRTTSGPRPATRRSSRP
jgi:branched-chain amino acid transport system ATP-binding protein